MRFHFPLETVLRLRRLLEGQARERLDEAMSQLRAIEHNLAQAIEWSRKSATVRSSTDHLPAAELQFIESVLFQTQQAIADCRHRKQLAEQRADQLRSVYLEARRARETVSILRENALRRFHLEQSRREQSEMDEVFLGKLVHTRNAARQTAGDPNRQPVHDRNLT